MIFAVFRCCLADAKAERSRALCAARTVVIVQVLRAVPLRLGVVDGVAPALQVDDLGAAHGHELELVRG
jgi:hypothetical protein